MKLDRRQLSFATLEEAVFDAERLLACGYQRVGNWDLAQCCHHLAVLMNYPIDGFPKYPFPLNLGTWMLRYTLAPRMLQKILDSGQWPPGLPTDKRTVPSSGGDDAKGVEELRQSIKRLEAHRGPFHASPLLGLLNMETLIKLHRTHTAHHLSFLIPNGDRQRSENPCDEPNSRNRRS